jgi:Cof subfamily protein (haloacid dehalogenase superfamily)
LPDVRLLATDLDGTALGPGGVVSPVVRAAFDRARAAGIEVIIATGRPPRFAHRAAVELGTTGIAVCANGSVTYDVATETLVHVDPLDAAVRPIVERLRDAAPGVAFAAEWELTFAFEAAFEAAIPERPDDPPLVDDVLDIDAAMLHKLLAVHPDLDGPSLWEIADDVLDGVAAPSHSGLGFVEIAGHGVNKASALARLCEERGIDVSEVAAVGDNLNDLEMLRWAGRSFAMGGSSTDVLAAADEVVADHHHDGAAEVVDRLLA